MKISKKNSGVRGLGGGVGFNGGQAGCERRIEVFVKISKKKNSSGGGGGGGGGWGWGGGVRVDVNEELKFLCKFQKKKISSGGVGLRGRVEGGQAGCENFNKKKFWGEGGGGGEGSGLMGVRLDVNEELKFL